MREAAPAGAARAVVAAAPAAAQRSLAIKQFDARMAWSNQDGTIDVTETITVRFSGSWNGLYRTIPVEYRTPQGFNWTLRLDFLGATRRPEGTPLKVESSRERHYLKYKIWVPGAAGCDSHHRLPLSGQERASLLRRSRRAVLERHRRRVGCADRGCQAPSSSCRRRATGVRAIAFNGAYGVDLTGCAGGHRRHHGSTVHAARARLSRGPHRRGRVGQGPDSRADRIGQDPRFPGQQLATRHPDPGLRARCSPSGISVGRDPGRLPVVVRYEPPAGMTPAEAGTLIDESVDMRDITATVVDLAVRGLSQDRGAGGGGSSFIFKKQDYIFRQARRSRHSPLQPHERRRAVRPVRRRSNRSGCPNWRTSSIRVSPASRPGSSLGW